MAARVTEDALHIALAQWLRYQPLVGLWWHTPNTHSSVQHAVKLKRMGMLSGVLDFQFLHPENRIAFIELKRRGGVLNPSQKIFVNWLTENAISYVVIRTDSVDEMCCSARTFLSDNGFFR